jgi:hypothetical protein
LGPCVTAEKKSVRPVGQNGQYLASGVRCYKEYMAYSMVGFG